MKSNNKQINYLTYFLIKSSMFGLGYSRLFALSKQDTWIGALLGSLIGIVIVYLISYIIKNKKQTLRELTSNNIIIKLLIIGLCSYFILEQLTILVNFSTSFLLLKTPGFIIALCATIISLYISNLGINSILKSTEILFKISLFLFIIIIITLPYNIDLTNFIPILTVKINALYKTIIIYALYTSIPLILLINLDIKKANLINPYIKTSIMILILIILILGIFGKEFTMTLRYPEYILLKRIKLLSFIEKIENLLAVFYIIDNLCFLIMSTYTIKNITKYKISYYIIILITFLFTSLIINNNYINALNNYYLSPYIFTIGLLIILLVIKQIKKKPKLQIQRDT